MTPTAGNYAKRKPGAQYQEIAKGLDAAGITTVDLDRTMYALDVAAEELYLNHGTDDHFSVAGHRLFADAIVQAVVR